MSAATKSSFLLARCALARAGAGGCAWCAAPLPPGRRAWCGERCSVAFWKNHWWTLARRAAKRRDRYRCVRCGRTAPKRPSAAAFPSRADYLAAFRAWREARRTGRLEVNHRVPCLGAHGTLSCSHHLENLETLCVACHRAHTAALPRPARATAG
jgi:5-methylcytosine-specific restriction endonuclease McrA